MNHVILHANIVFCEPSPATGAEKGILSAVEQVIGKMKNHETARIAVKSQYGFGEEGNAELNIPKDADLVYEVRVNNFTKVR